MPAGSSVRIDRRDELAMLSHYTPREVSSALLAAGEAGAKAGASVLRAAAPVGSGPLSRLYRRLGLTHGALREAVRGVAFHGPDGLIGFVLGPIGRGAVARHWVELGTRRGMRANPWLERTAPAANAAAHSTADRALAQYGRTK